MFFVSCAFLPIPFFFFNDTATTEIYTLSLHDALPISTYPFDSYQRTARSSAASTEPGWKPSSVEAALERSEEHTSELQSPCNLVCRLLLEKKKHSSSILMFGPLQSP